MEEKILVTGCAGFIGFHVCKQLIKKGLFVIGLDNLNNYYDISLKRARLKEIENFSKNNIKGEFLFIKADLKDEKILKNISKVHLPKKVIHLAAQAGVRHSIENPRAYINSNLVGFGNVLEFCKDNQVDHLIYASSSSIYGGNKKIPFSEKDFVDYPVSLYAATKKSNELMAHSYSHLFKLPSTGIRLFTVYGPWGRPDMAPMIFTKSILSSKPIKIFNNGEMFRDFTYIDDVSEAILKLLHLPPKYLNDDKNLNSSELPELTPHRIINIGSSNPINLLEFIDILESEINIKAIRVFEKMQLGDVKKTYADTSYIEDLINYKPNTSLKNGIREFVKWYKNFYKLFS
ncbi:Putative nucleotide sugar epimerase [Prochlorococcus marinus str. MIT 9515]|uniref:Putative nucleotide sugar epimerase n=1 Tax=Prochlorococcus marinus (strain MIT 9515) TaxID=167542 RepID=A2BXR7_PROM5|nr:NAD-dependent epimerase/dehydratase family protein [Prochlorococcus marinus]ABM72578.1 Putative nucleotide sugar epimerase [Prochlorococcus marinus str. MIT 9515]